MYKAICFLDKNSKLYKTKVAKLNAAFVHTNLA